MKKYLNIRDICGKCLLVLLLSLSTAFSALSQDLELANEYYQQKEWEKALSLYERLSKDEEMIEDIHQAYFATLIQLKEYKDAKKYLRKRIKNEPLNPRYQVDYGVLLREQGDEKGMNEHLASYLSDIRRDDTRLKRLGVLLINAGLLELAEEAYLQGQRNNQESFYIELASLYDAWGKKEQMYKAYLDLLREAGERYRETALDEVQGRLLDYIEEKEDQKLLEMLIYQYLQKNPNRVAYNQMLVWLYLQQKEFYKAFTQAKAIDRRLKAEGREIMSIGDLSYNNEAYEDAVKIYSHLVDKYPNSGFVYIHSKNMLIKSKEQLVKQTYPVDIAAIRSLVKDYTQIIEEFGIRNNTAEPMMGMSRLYAFYLNEPDTAVSILNKLLEQPRIPRRYTDQAKLDLGDIYILKGEPWESALLYAQVEKSQKDKLLGHEAKLRSAKLSYYKGDFNLAKGHLDVLKLATSREIANDAMNLSLLIQDNLELDTSKAALQDYAQVDLLKFKGAYPKALQEYDKLLEKYKGHTLTDEILWEKSNILYKLGEFEKATESLELLLEKYSDDILGDDANFLAASIYEENLGQKEKAKQMYIDHLLKYPDSIFVTEARKRARRLRGDRQ